MIGLQSEDRNSNAENLFDNLGRKSFFFAKLQIILIDSKKKLEGEVISYEVSSQLAKYLVACHLKKARMCVC